MFTPDGPFRAPKIFREWQTKREIADPTSIHIDMARASSHISAHIMYTDFRETFDLRDRKALKVGALLCFMNVLYGRMSSGSIPANTVADGTTVFYDNLENTCVRMPGEARKDSVNLVSEINEDMDVILGHGKELNLREEIEALLQYTNAAEARPTTVKQLSRWSKQADDIQGVFRDVCRRVGITPIAMDGAAPFTLNLMDEITQQISEHKQGNKAELIF